MADLPFPDSILATHTAVLGKTGSGKTYSSKVIVEHLVRRGARVCVLDPIKSDWWGLTSSADGRAPGLPFHILGGPRGHVPIDARAGAAVGSLVGRGALRLSIIDMADFEPGGLQRFFVDFARAIWKDARGVLHLVIEEAHEFAPKERAGFGEETQSIHWAKKLATGGRTKGIRLILASQRVQSLHNALLSSCETVIPHRLTMDADQEPVLRWLKGADKARAAEVGSTLFSLPTGTAWVCSGEAGLFERVKFPRISTFDNSATPTDDTPPPEDVVTAAVDLAALQKIVGAAVEDAAANDPAALKREIARLRATQGNADNADLRAEYARGMQDGRSAMMSEMHDRLFRLGGELAAEVEAIVGRCRDSLGSTPAAEHAAPPRQTGVTDVAALRREREPASPSAAMAGRVQPRRNGEASGRETGTTRMLRALAESPGGLTEPQWATSAAIKPTGGTWRTYRARLVGDGLVEQRGDAFILTAAGRAAAPPVSVPRTPGELRELWGARLGVGPTRMMAMLARRGALSRASLAEETGHALDGGTFRTYLGRLITNRLAERRGDTVHLAAELCG